MKHTEAAIQRTTATGAGSAGPLPDPTSATYVLAALAGGVQTLSFYVGGRVVETYTFTQAEAQSLGAALTAGTALKGP